MNAYLREIERLAIAYCLAWSRAIWKSASEIHLHGVGISVGLILLYATTYPKESTARGAIGLICCPILFGVSMAFIKKGMEEAINGDQ